MTMKVLTRWRGWIGAAVAMVAIGAVTAAAFLNVRIVTGTATANPVAVMTAANERKEAAELAAAEQKAAADAAFVTNLEGEVQQSMQAYFDDPANRLQYEGIVVSAVTLMKTADTTFEGMATMAAGGRSARDIAVHVTADDRNLMWTTDPGALLPLFR
jgi:hypothetical protein